MHAGEMWLSLSQPFWQCADVSAVRAWKMAPLMMLAPAAESSLLRRVFKGTNSIATRMVVTVVDLVGLHEFAVWEARRCKGEAGR